MKSKEKDQLVCLYKTIIYWKTKLKSKKNQRNVSHMSGKGREEYWICYKSFGKQSSSQITHSIGKGLGK